MDEISQFKKDEIRHELRHEDEWNRQQQQRPKLIGMHFFNVPAGKEGEAQACGMKQTKSGKWALKKFDKSNPRRYNDKYSMCKQAFGDGRWWEPK